MVDTAPKPFVFVLMPFEAAFDDVYKLGIKPACIDAGAYCERVDEQHYDGSILARVYNQIAKADIIIADMTGKNPNVFYEVGYAHALAKQVILATESVVDIPFDLMHYPHIVYAKSIVSLKDQLATKVRLSIENPQRRVEAVAKNLNLYIGGKLLYEGFQITYPTPIKAMSLEIHNPTSKTVPSGSIRIGLIATNGFDGDTAYFVKAVPLPDNQTMYLFPNLETLFPFAWESLGFQLLPSDLHNPFTEEREQWVFRVFSEFGLMDYPVAVMTGYSRGIRRALYMDGHVLPITFRNKLRSLPE
jgi:hypothetical protein